MKKFITMGMLALAVAAVCSAPAPAWLNWRFGIGLNFGWQSGGNNTLWGLFRNGQPPGPDCGFGGCGGGCPLPGSSLFGPPGFAPPPGVGLPPNPTGADAGAPTRAIPQSFQSSQQSQWNNYTAGYRYPYYPYQNYGYNYGYNYNYPR